MGAEPPVELWQRIGQVFADAVDLTTCARATFLVRECAGQTLLRREVERLLKVDSDASRFFAKPLGRLGDASPPAAADLAGARTGPYRLIHRLSQGGMGVVYLAVRVDHAYRRRVAIKVIREGLDSDEARRKFLLERQILAGLEHPNIARLYDGGATDDGRPYLVMEYIDGVPITEHCARQHLSIAARLELFVRVCRAVEHAHRHSLVHCDLKPKNILVTAEGVPKLLDFGIARVVRRGRAAAAGPVLMTPAYASPEQVRGEPVTPASDVYSLGVLLYELLTGRSPYDRHGASPVDLAEAICSAEPRPPSAVAAEVDALGLRRSPVDRQPQRQLCGDLDAIVLKALRKEPRGRYRSARALARDLRHHQRHLPVAARRAAVGYLLSKALLRQRAVAVVGGLLLALLVLLAWQGVRLANFESHSDHAIGELIGWMTAPAPASAGRHLLDSAVPRLLGGLSHLPAERASLLETLGDLYSQAGIYDVAKSLLEMSLEIRQQLDPRRRDLSQSLHRLGLVATGQGDLEDGEGLLRRAIDLRRRQAGDSHPWLAESLEALALTRWQAGDFGQAHALLERTVEIRSEACGAMNPVVAQGKSVMASILRQQGQLDEAERLAREAFALRRRELGDGHPHLAASYDDLADLHYSRGEYRQAEAYYRRALALRRQVFGDEHQEVADSLHRLARCLGERGAYESAERLFLTSLDISRRLYRQASPRLATLYNNLAIVSSYQGDHTAAEALLRRVIAMRERLLGKEHPHVAQAHYSLGRVLHDQGHLDAAERLYRQAERQIARSLPADHRARAYPQVALARLLVDRGKAREAEELLRPALALLRRTHPAGHWRVAHAEGLLGRCFLARHRWRVAEPLLARSLGVVEAQRGRRAPRARRLAADLAAVRRLRQLS